MAQINSKKATLRITNHGMAVLKEEGMKAKGESCLKLFQRNQLFGPFDNGMMVKIMCAHGHFQVHKALVGSKSQLLADLINGAEAKIAGQTPVIRLAETDINIAEKLFRCLYQGYTIVNGAQEYNKIEALSRTLGFGEFLSTNPTCDDKVGDCELNYTIEEGTGRDRLSSIESQRPTQTLAITQQEKTNADASNKLSGSSSQFHNVGCQESRPLVVVTQRRVKRPLKQDGIIDRQAIREDIRDTQARPSTTQNPSLAVQSTSRARSKSHPPKLRPPFGQIIKNSVNEDPTPSTSKACGTIRVHLSNNTDTANQSAKRPFEASSSKSLGETTTTDKAPATFLAPNAPGPKKCKVDEVQPFVKTAHVIIPPKAPRKQPAPNTNHMAAEPKQSTSKGSTPDINPVPEFRKVAREALQSKVPRKNPARQYKPPQRYSDFSDSYARKSPTKTNKLHKANENHLESSLVESMEEGHSLTERTTKASPRVKKTENEPCTSLQGASRSRRPSAQVGKAAAVNSTEITSKTTSLPRKGALRETRQIVDVPIVPKCDFCKKVCRDETALIRHMHSCQPHLKVTVSGVTKRQCSFCSSNHQKTTPVGFLRHVARCYAIVNQLSDEDGKTPTLGNQASRNPEKNEGSNLLKASGVHLAMTQGCKNKNFTSSAASRPTVNVSSAKQNKPKGVKHSEPTSDDGKNSSSVGSPISQGEVIPIKKCEVSVASSDVKGLLGVYKAGKTLNGIDDIVVTSAVGKAVRREMQISLPTKSLKQGGKNRNICKPVATGISSQMKNQQKSKAKKGVAKSTVGRQVIRKRIGPASKIGRKMLIDGKITKVDATPARVVETPPPILKPETFTKVGPACKTGRRPVPKPGQHPPILIPMTQVIQYGTSNTAASRNSNQENMTSVAPHNTSSKESNNTDLSTMQAKPAKQVTDVVSSRDITSLSLEASQTRVSIKSSHEETNQNVVKTSGINVGTDNRGIQDKDDNISSIVHTGQTNLTSPNTNGLNAGSMATNDSRSEASTNFKIPDNPTKPKPKRFSAQNVVKKMQQVLSKPRVMSQTPTELSATDLSPSAGIREPSSKQQQSHTTNTSPETTEMLATPVCSGQPSNSEDRLKITTDRFGTTTGKSMDWIRENHLKCLLDGQTDLTASLQPDTSTQMMVEKATVGNSVQHTKKGPSKQLQLQDETELEEIEFSAITPTDLANGILNVREENDAGDSPALFSSLTGDELSNEQNEFSQDYEDSSGDEEMEEDMYQYEMSDTVDGTSYICLKCSLNFKVLDSLKDHICI